MGGLSAGNWGGVIAVLGGVSSFSSLHFYKTSQRGGMGGMGYGGSAENGNCSFSARSLGKGSRKELLHSRHFPNVSAVQAVLHTVFIETSQQSCVVNTSGPILQVGRRQAGEIQ